MLGGLIITCHLLMALLLVALPLLQRPSVGHLSRYLLMLLMLLHLLTRLVLLPAMSHRLVG
jgi:hypothetical protein